MTLFKHNHSISLLVIAALLLPISAFAATESTPIVATTSAVSSVQACLKPLFEKRETMITAAWDIEYIEIKKSMDTRKATILGALEMNDIKQSRKAISTAHKDFRDWVRKARSMSRENRRLAWEAFKTDTSSCGKKAATSLESATSNSSTIDVKAE